VRCARWAVVATVLLTVAACGDDAPHSDPVVEHTVSCDFLGSTDDCEARLLELGIEGCALAGVTEVRVVMKWPNSRDQHTKVKCTDIAPFTPSTTSPS